MATTHVRATTDLDGNIAADCEQIPDAIGALQARAYQIDRLAGQPLRDELVPVHISLLRAWDLVDQVQQAFQIGMAL